MFLFHRRKKEIDTKEVDDLIGRLRRIQEDIGRYDDEREAQGISRVYERPDSSVIGENATQLLDDLEQRSGQHNLEESGPVISQELEEMTTNTNNQSSSTIRAMRDESPIPIEIEDDWRLNFMSNEEVERQSLLNQFSSNKRNDS